MWNGLELPLCTAGTNPGGPHDVWGAEAVPNHKLVGSSHLCALEGVPITKDTREQAEHLHGCSLLTQYERARSCREAARLRR